jgi:outer membrane protein assembly factor BamB
VFVAPAVAGEDTYVGSCSGFVYAFDTATGDVRWSYDTGTDGPRAQFHGDLLVTDDLVVVGADARPQAYLYAFERRSGAVRWQHPFPGGVAVDLIRFGDSVVATSMGGDVFAVDLTSGEILWWTQTESSTARMIPTDPALIDNRFFVPWRSGHLEAFDVLSGELLWRRRLPDTPNTSLSVIDGSLVVGTAGRQILRLRATDGETLSTLDLDGMPYGELVLADDCLIVLRSDQGSAIATCVESDLSSVRWRYDSTSPGEWGTFEPMRLDDVILVGGRDLLVALRIADGSVAWTLPVTNLPRGLGASEEFLLVGTLPGPVYAYPWRDH